MFWLGQSQDNLGQISALVNLFGGLWCAEIGMSISPNTCYDLRSGPVSCRKLEDQAGRLVCILYFGAEGV